MDESERTRWRQAYASTVCERAQGGSWRRIDPPPSPLALITGWNPFSQRKDEAINRELDAQLDRHLVALGVAGERARGCTRMGRAAKRAG